MRRGTRGRAYGLSNKIYLKILLLYFSSLLSFLPFDQKLKSTPLNPNQLKKKFDKIIKAILYSAVPTFVEVGRAQKRSSSNASHPEIISDKF